VQIEATEANLLASQNNTIDALSTRPGTRKDISCPVLAATARPHFFAERVVTPFQNPSDFFGARSGDYGLMSSGLQRLDLPHHPQKKRVQVAEQQTENPPVLSTLGVDSPRFSFFVLRLYTGTQSYGVSC
jgi:hypothetical protein